MPLSPNKCHGGTPKPLVFKAQNREKQDREGACSRERKHKKRHIVSEVIYGWQVEADEHKKKKGVGMFLNYKKKKFNRCSWHFADYFEGELFLWNSRF